MLAMLLPVAVGVPDEKKAASFVGDQVWRFRTETDAQARALHALADDERLDFWDGPAPVPSDLDVRVPARNAGWFRGVLGNIGITPTVWIENVQRLLDAQHAQRVAAPWASAFHSFATTTADI